MILQPDGPAPTCPVCGGPLNGAVIWGMQGDIGCPKGHYRGYAFSNFRRMGYGRLVAEPARGKWFGLRSLLAFLLGRAAPPDR